MLSSTFQFASAGVLARGGVDARPYACAAVRPSLLPAAVPTVAVLDGTRVPVAGMPRRRNAEDLAGFAGVVTATALPITTQHDPISTKNDGTTPLGIHPRGRSTS